MSGGAGDCDYFQEQVLHILRDTSCGFCSSSGSQVAVAGHRLLYALETCSREYIERQIEAGLADKKTSSVSHGYQAYLRGKCAESLGIYELIPSDGHKSIAQDCQDYVALAISPRVASSTMRKASKAVCMQH